MSTVDVPPRERSPRARRSLVRLRRVERALTPAVLLGLYALVLAFGFVTHELWFDELQAWAIARDAGSWADLVDRRRYEGHPIAWHALLWAASGMSRSPMVLQVIQAGSALAVAALIAYRAPFRPLVRAGLLFSYFALYEYGVLARPYALGVLCILGAATLARRPQRPLWAIAVLLALATQTTAFGVIGAVAVATGLAVDELLGRPPPKRLVHLAGAGALVGGAAVLALLQIIPPADAPFGGGGGGGLDTGQSWRQPFAIVSPAVLPLRAPGELSWIDYQLPRPWGGLLGVVIAAAVTVLLARRPAPLVIWLAGASAMLFLATWRFGGSLRHHGHLVVLITAAAWIFDRSRSWPPAAAAMSPPRVRVALQRAAPAAVAVVLVVQVAATGSALVSAAVHPFGAPPAVVDRLDELGLRSLPLVGYSDFSAVAVAALADRPVFLASRGEVATYARWDDRRRRVDAEELARIARDRAVTVGPVVLLSNSPIDAADFTPLGVYPDPALRRTVHLYHVPPPD